MVYLSLLQTSYLAIFVNRKKRQNKAKAAGFDAHGF
jgi:hypothetical protein